MNRIGRLFLHFQPRRRAIRRRLGLGGHATSEGHPRRFSEVDEPRMGNLVLTLNRGAAIELDGRATVTLLNADHGRAHLRFTAPLTTKVLRTELTKEPASAA